MNIEELRKLFEKIHCGNNTWMVSRNDHGLYLSPSIEDAWSGWQSAAEYYTCRGNK